VKKKQVREVLQFLVTRVRAQVQDLGHRRGSNSIIKSAPFIAESFVVPQCPKGRGYPAFTKRYSIACHISSRLFALALQWLIGDGLFAGCGNTSVATDNSIRPRRSSVVCITTSRKEVQRIRTSSLDIPRTRPSESLREFSRSIFLDRH
jgi:hypothetical protein